MGCIKIKPNNLKYFYLLGGISLVAITSLVGIENHVTYATEQLDDVIEIPLEETSYTEYIKNYYDIDNIYLSITDEEVSKDTTKREHTIEISDKYGIFQKEKKITIQTVDIKKPTIKLINNTLEFKEDIYSLFEFKDNFNEEKDLKKEVIDFDNKTLGEQTIKLKVSDKSNNIREVKYKINVVDNKKPKISYDKDIVIEEGENIDYLNGISVSDNFSTNKYLMKNLIIDDSLVDTSTVGEYVVSYTVKDNSKNEFKLNRKVIVNKKYVPENPIEYKVNESVNFTDTYNQNTPQNNSSTVNNNIITEQAPPVVQNQGDFMFHSYSFPIRWLDVAGGSPVPLYENNVFRWTTNSNILLVEKVSPPGDVIQSLGYGDTVTIYGTTYTVIGKQSGLPNIEGSGSSSEYAHSHGGFSIITCDNYSPNSTQTVWLLG